MNVAFDVDGVLANFSKGFCGVLKDLYGIELDPDACKSWYWFEWVDGLTKEMEDQAWAAIMTDPRYQGFWRGLFPLCTAEDVTRINRLSEDHVVTFVTNRAAEGQHENVVAVTRGWLSRQGFRPNQNVFLAPHGRKGEVGRSLGTHIAVEDNGDNAVDYLRNGIAVALLRRPYNEGYVELVKERGGYIVDTLGKLLDLCERGAEVQRRALEEQTA